MRQITYAYNKEDGLVISRLGDKVAWPILDFAAIGRGGHGFEVGDCNGPIIYNLEAFSVHSIGHEWSEYKWTKKIPIALKNKHRAFWGFKPLKEKG